MLAQQYQKFTFTLTLSQPTEAWQGKKGHVEEYIFADIKNPAENDFYLCGSKAMTDEMRGKLKAAGVPETQVKFELFY